MELELSLFFFFNYFQFLIDCFCTVFSLTVTKKYVYHHMITVQSTNYIFSFSSITIFSFRHSPGVLMTICVQTISVDPDARMIICIATCNANQTSRLRSIIATSFFYLYQLILLYQLIFLYQFAKLGLRSLSCWTDVMSALSD